MFPNVEVRHLHAAIALGEELNFTKAALRLHLTQSALNGQITEIESGLDSNCSLAIIAGCWSGTHRINSAYWWRRRESNPRPKMLLVKRATCLVVFMPWALPQDVRGPRSEPTRNASR